MRSGVLHYRKALSGTACVKISVQSIDLNVLNMRTRMPFRYGIASLESVPHLFLRVTADVNGATATGVAAEGLPPKWFTKNPDTSFAEDLDEMLAVIRQAVRFALDAPAAASPFDLWHEVFLRQTAWAETTPYPPLLWGFGVSMVERAVIDAFCRATGRTFGQALHENSLGVRLEAIHPELAGHAPAALLPERANRTMVIRHTVGLADPLTDSDVPPEERLGDGLPQSLEASVRFYGLTHLKIKLSGDTEADIERLQRIARIMETHAPAQYAHTLDGNEFYTEVGPFRQFWETIQAEPSLRSFLSRALFVEQPFHRDAALAESVKDDLRRWRERPPLIIDESDGEMNSLADALACGYAGGSHKNCKGVFRGIVNACLLALYRQRNPGQAYILSSEDLCSVGPVAMIQDLTVAANLGIEHAERNGHHYFAGLSMYPQSVQAQVLARHGTIYRRHAAGYPALDVRQGRVDVSSIVDAPFGYDFDFDTTQFTPLAQWSVESLAD